jgi:hypothetical protein
MTNKNITDQILRFLNSYGVGYYKDISELIRSAFPIQVNDISDDIYSTRILHYLDNLERLNYIKCNNTNITLRLVHIEAAILDAGARHIRPNERSNLSKATEFLFWVAGIGVLILMLFEYYHPERQGETSKSKLTTVHSDTALLKRSPNSDVRH